ncbi:MAG: phosphoribosyltransferase [Nitrosopumilaceae archaeon]
MFANRSEAGKLLAEKLSDIKGSDCIVLAIPHGGAVIGDQIAQTLGCKLDVVVSKKINPPDYPEYAIGAVMPDGTIHWNQDMSAYLENSYLVNEINQKKDEAQRQLKVFRNNTSYHLDGKTVILVDDGIATGASVFVILKWLKKHNPKKIVVAAPVMPAETYEQLKKMSDSVISLLIPTAFHSVSEFYEKFKQVSDDEVVSILSKYKSA